MSLSLVTDQWQNFSVTFRLVRCQLYAALDLGVYLCSQYLHIGALGNVMVVKSWA